MEFQLSPKQVEALLYELCVVLGFCLPPNANVQFTHEPPTGVDEFTDAVIQAEGLDPYANVPLHLRRDAVTEWPNTSKPQKINITTTSKRMSAHRKKKSTIHSFERELIDAGKGAVPQNLGNLPLMA
jgi:hypothetical protein